MATLHIEVQAVESESSVVTSFKLGAAKESTPAGSVLVTNKDKGSSVKAHAFTKALTKEDAIAFAVAAPNAVLSLMHSARVAMLTEASKAGQNAVAMDLPAIVKFYADRTSAGTKLSKAVVEAWLPAMDGGDSQGFALVIAWKSSQGVSDLATIAKSAAGLAKLLPEVATYNASRGLRWSGSDTVTTTRQATIRAFLTFAAQAGDDIAEALLAKHTQYANPYTAEEEAALLDAI